jgi:outer membrane protein assembly factor BamB
MSIDAELFLVGARSGFAAGVRRLACGPYGLESPVGIDVEWSDRELRLHCSREVEVKLKAPGDETTVTVGREGAVVDIPDEVPLDALATALQLLRPSRVSPSAEAPVTPFGKSRWTFQSPKPGDAVTACAAADLNGDGCDEILAGSEQGGMWCLASDGRTAWQAAAKGRITTAGAGRLDRSAQKCALFGSEDCKVYAFAPDGTPKWSYEMPTYKQAGRVRVLLAADLDGDGIDEVIVGGDNWRYYVLDAQGRERWHYESVHPASAGAAVDLDGDGQRELLCGTVYYWWHCAGPDGAKRWSYSVKGPHATVALGVNFAGGKTRDAVFGSEDGNLHVISPTGKPLWMANVGDQVTGALAVDLAGRGPETLVASSLSFNVFALGGDGKVLWRRNLGSPVECLAAAGLAGKMQLVAGCQDGSLVLIDGQGHAVGRYEAGSAVLAVTAAPMKKGGPTQIVLRLADGRVVGLGL